MQTNICICNFVNNTNVYVGGIICYQYNQSRVLENNSWPN